MTRPRILVAGLGNIFLGDDAFGVEVAQRLLRRPQPPDVHIVDFGIRGVDLFYALLDGCGVAILVDAVSRGQSPGTLYLIEPEPAPPNELPPEELMIQTHSMDPLRVLQLVGAMNDRIGRVLLVGCEPTPVGPDDDGMPTGMSDAVQSAVTEAVGVVESLVEKILKGDDELTIHSFNRAANSLVAGEKEVQTW
jgi:hydrogenase maturation protease